MEHDISKLMYARCVVERTRGRIQMQRTQKSRFFFLSLFVRSYSNLELATYKSTKYNLFARHVAFRFRKAETANCITPLFCSSWNTIRQNHFLLEFDNRDLHKSSA